MEYADGETPLETGDDGVVYISREEDEVFHPHTMASFEGKAVTIKHPTDFVSPDNWSYLAKGVLQNVRRGDKDDDGEHSLVADLLITDAMAIQLVKAGLREVSCGYEAEYEQTGKGKGKQTKIIGNHCALVEEGRAGSSYAINDHKGKGTMATVIEKLIKKFGAKAVDEAMAEKKEEKASDAYGMDELVKAVKDVGERMARVEGFMEQGNADGGGKGINKEDKATAAGKMGDEDKEEKPAKDEDSEKEKESKDEESEGEMKMEERLKALEAAVSKLLEGKAKADDEEGEEGEESQAKAGDEDMEGEESEDDDFENSEMTGDSKSRVEILAPGLKAVKGKDVRITALETAYGTKEGKEVLEALCGGKPTFDSKERVATLFVAASEVLKSKRGNGLSRTKDSSAWSMGESKMEVMTAEKMNEINAAHWARK